MVLSSTIINHTLPAVSVNVDDSSGVTYKQLKNSLGSQVYNVEGLYLYSSNISQLIGTIKYSRYDASGSQDIIYIATTVDPYQFVSSLNVDLTQTSVPIVFNGNSSVATTILPNNYLQIKFKAKRVTNSFGMNLYNFQQMQKITNSNFFNNYGADIEVIQESNIALRDSIHKSFDGIENENKSKKILQFALLSAATLSIAYCLLKKNE